MLAFKPFDSWAPGSDWTLGLPQGEEAVAVAAGATFCAAVTSKQCLRIFSISGTCVSLLPCLAPARQKTCEGSTHAGHTAIKGSSRACCSWVQLQG